RKKNSSPFNRTPAPNPLQRRRFKVPKPPEKVVRRSPEEQKAFLQQKLEQAAFVGYNGLNVPVKASETPPPQPIQQKPASGGSEDNYQPLLGQRTNLRLNGLNRLTSETPVQTKRKTPSDDTQEGISESETLEETGKPTPPKLDLVPLVVFYNW
ncbi:MAG: hypothetical protein RLP02_32010, partial [Coleofasciculus sp. C2-GNP5-27]